MTSTKTSLTENGWERLMAGYWQNKREGSALIKEDSCWYYVSSFEGSITERHGPFPSLKELVYWLCGPTQSTTYPA